MIEELENDLAPPYLILGGSANNACKREINISQRQGSVKHFWYAWYSQPINPWHINDQNLSSKKKKRPKSCHKIEKSHHKKTFVTSMSIAVYLW